MKYVVTRVVGLLCCLLLLSGAAGTDEVESDKQEENLIHSPSAPPPSENPSLASGCEKSSLKEEGAECGTVADPVEDTAVKIEKSSEARAYPSDGGFFLVECTPELVKEGVECYVPEVAEKQKVVKDVADLIIELEQSLEKLKAKEPVANTDYEKFDKKERRAHYEQYYSQHLAEAQDFILLCMAIPLKAQKNNIECQSAMLALLGSLKMVQQEELAQQEQELRYREYFRSSAEKVDDLLEGRCKGILNDPWYEFDESLHDKECDAALVAKKQLRKLKLFEQQEEEKKKKGKDIAYYRGDIDAAKQRAASCRDDVNKDPECRAAMQATEEVAAEERKRSQYVDYYLTHPLAAQYFIAECASRMAHFNIECQAALEAIKKQPEKLPEKDQAKEAAFVREFRNNPFEARIIVGGLRCRSLFADQWYYLDESLQDEECDAAAKVVYGRAYQ